MAQVIHRLFDKGRTASFMITSDGTTSNATIIDVSTLEGAIAGKDQRVRIKSVSCLNAGISGDDKNYSIHLLWDGGTDQLIATLPMGQTELHLGQGVVDPSSVSGLTGDIVLKTTASVEYTIFINIEKTEGFYPSSKYNRNLA